jgi:hypothetical protein
MQLLFRFPLKQRSTVLGFKAQKGPALSESDEPRGTHASLFHGVNPAADERAAMNAQQMNREAMNRAADERKAIYPCKRS